MKKRNLRAVFASLLAASAVIGLASCGSKKDDNVVTPPSDTSDGTTQTYTVTFNTDGGSNVDSQTINSGSKATVPTNPTKEADSEYTYTFEGWYTDEAKTTAFSFDTEITANLTLYAKWSKKAVVHAAIELNGVAYESIAKALAAIPTNSTDTFKIVLQKGTYNENGLSYNGSATVVISGDTTANYGTDVIIKGHGSDMSTEKGRNLISILGSGNIILENITLESDWFRADHSGDVQAEVLGTDTTGNTVAYNCSFKSHQDTLRTAGKAWFYNCYIEGDVDFIWMEAAGSVALYEKCEIVSIYDEFATTHNSYLTAPRMSESTKVGKGLVIYNSTVKESDEAKANGQKTYLARTPWTSGYYNQVAYINTTCQDVESEVWYKSQIATDYDKTIIGWKMDKKTAESLGYAGNGDIVTDEVVNVEYSGREAILNRIYDIGKSKYVKDSSNYFDIASLITAYGWSVDTDSSKSLLDGETESITKTYMFDGTQDVSSLVNGFSLESGKTHYKGNSGSTITIPLTGKSYIEVYGYYSGTVEATAGSQGAGVLFFNNGSTKTTIEQDYIVYDEDAKEVVITAKGTTYITKIVVVTDSTIVKSNVEDITIKASSDKYVVGVALDLDATVTPNGATNKSVKWTSSDTTIATIDEYSGKVTFLKAGSVVFSATALDGSGVSKTFECDVTEATWTEAEWYTVDQTIAEEDGATNIGSFAVNSSAYKAIGTTYSFTNLNGQTISTVNGLKLNGSGKLSISTTKESTLTVIIADNGKLAIAEPKVTNGTTTVTAGSSYVVSNGLTAYVYRLTEDGTWDITRPGSSEVAPIIYAKCVYDAVWDFKNASPSEITSVNIQSTTGTIASNISGIELSVDATNSGKLAYSASGYAQFNANTIINVAVKNVGSVITVVSYPGQYNYTVGGSAAEADTTTYTVTAEDVTTGYVSITATSTSYLYSITLTNSK